MQIERWKKIEELYDTAQRQPEDRRAEFLRQACPDDPELRAEVESLLKAADSGDALLDGSPLSSIVELPAFKAGDKLGNFQILALLGRGGMGVVYRARDSRLGRDVAIKVLPAYLARDTHARARFEREAKAVAALNHPHICSLYEAGPGYLVMELVEGATLGERIARGALPMDDALAIARQIAQALEAAHEKGIVHRDLKPANIKITPAGVVKVLDFGLATVTQGSGLMLDDPENSPTRTSTLSRSGVIMGTAAYMSPEQARGQVVDKRADIWAFGVVLYEMLTGRRLFEGDSSAEILSAVFTKEPEWERTPAETHRLLRSCLEKDPKRRLRDIGDVWRLLEEGPRAEVPLAGGLPWKIAAAVFAATALVLAFVHFRRGSEEPQSYTLSILAPDRGSLDGGAQPSVSPDGRRVAFVAATRNFGKSELWVRDLDSPIARALPGTIYANGMFWSPDSRFIGFFADGKLKRISVATGPPVALAAANSGAGGDWNDEGVILFSDSASGLFRISADGGTATQVTTTDKGLFETDHLWPSFLPDGRHFLYTAVNKESDKTAIYIGDLKSKDRRRLMIATSAAIYAPPGYLLFLRDGALMAQPFDQAKLETKGNPEALADHVDNFGAGEFSASRNGILAYTSGLVSDLQLTWFDRSGRTLATVGAPGRMTGPSISPDGMAVADTRRDPDTGEMNIWLHDLTRGAASRLTYSAAEFPVWSPDGSHIAFIGSSGEILERAVRTGREDLLDPMEGVAVGPAGSRSDGVADWSRDGRFIIEIRTDPKTKTDIWVLPLFGDHKAFPYLRTPFYEGYAKLSPNGKWLAYASTETGRFEIYVQNFPAPGDKWQVSTNGGDYPLWSRDGKELFFLDPDRKMMVAEVKSALIGGKFEAGAPQYLFDTRPSVAWFDVGKDGRFLIAAQRQQATAPITVVINWPAKLKRYNVRAN